MRGSILESHIHYIIIILLLLLLFPSGASGENTLCHGIMCVVRAFYFRFRSSHPVRANNLYDTTRGCARVERKPPERENRDRREHAKKRPIILEYAKYENK